MKVKIHKESLKTLIGVHWWAFLLVPVVLSGAFFYFFHLMDKPKENEKIRIFSGFTFSDEINQTIYNDYRNKFTDYGILEATTYSLDENTTSYALTFGDTIFKNYEIVIASNDEYEVDKGIFDNSSIFLDTAYFNSSAEFLLNEDKPIGIKIYDSEDEEYNKKFTFSENIGLYKTTYAFASNKSFNSTRLIDEKHSLNELALKEFFELFVK